MAARKNKTRCGGRLTEAGFFGFIRAGLRAKWVRWGPRYDVLAAARRKSQSSNARLKWEFQCAVCKGWHQQKQVEVDHIIPCGSLKTFDDLPGFVSRLFVEADQLRVVCKDCHKEATSVSYS